MVQEKPGLFQPDDPKAAPKSSVPGRPRRRCAVCGESFEVRAGHARYCSKGCRRQRERWIARMCRAAVKGAQGDPKRPGQDCTPAEAQAYTAAVRGHAEALSRVAGYLSGRSVADPEGPPDPDPDLPPLPKRAALAVEARRQAARLSHLVQDAQRFEQAVAERHRERVVPRPAGSGRPERLAELDAAVSKWAARLEGSDGDV